ncbi:MAG: DUF433 domain-containing protein [Pirellulaceae bacterium]|nr:DUF433 domain-containing protein [Pirellulaceae bacterium]
MSIESLAHYSKDQLIAELINRETFAGVVIYHRGDVKAGQLEPGEVVMTKSPPLSREATEDLLSVGQNLIPEMFGQVLNESIKALGSHGERLPLRIDPGNVIRVGRSRVSLDLVVEQYENGMSPEDLVRAYETLKLAEVHAAIAFYLSHYDEVSAYLAKRKEEADSFRQQIEEARPKISREELESRRARENDVAPTDH